MACFLEANYSCSEENCCAMIDLKSHMQSIAKFPMRILCAYLPTIFISKGFDIFLRGQPCLAASRSKFTSLLHGSGHRDHWCVAFPFWMTSPRKNRWNMVIFCQSLGCFFLLIHIDTYSHIVLQYMIAQTCPWQPRLPKVALQRCKHRMGKFHRRLKLGCGLWLHHRRHRVLSQALLSQLHLRNAPVKLQRTGALWIKWERNCRAKETYINIYIYIKLMDLRNKPLYIYYHNMQWKITFELHMLINLVVDHVAPPSQSTHGFLSLNVPRGRTTAKKVRWAKMTWVRRRGHEASKCFLYMLWMKPLMKK